MDDPEYYAFRGNRYYQEGDYSVAIANYDRCIELALGVREFYLLRANAKSAKEDYAGALSDYGVSEECSRLYYGMAPGATLVRDLGRALIAFNRGNIKAAMKDYEGAVAEYDEAIAREAENESGDGAVFFNRGNAKTMLRRYDEATEDYDEAIRVGLIVGVGVANCWFNRGNALVMSGRFEEAIASYETCVVADGATERAVNNSVNAVRINEIVGQGTFVVSYEPLCVSDGRVVTVSVMVCNGSSEDVVTVLFAGSVGNTGNRGAGYLQSGGKGFSGGKAFMVRVLEKGVVDAGTSDE